MAQRELDREEFSQAAELAREARRVTCEQVRQLLTEADRMFGRGDLMKALSLVARTEKLIAHARGRQKQARVMGLPLEPSVTAEHEARQVLRGAVMDIAVACAGWAAQMDYQQAQRLEVAADEE